MDGGEGDDWVTGDEGNDVLAGGGGHDNIQGGSGDDTMDGGLGNDILSGSSHNTFHGWYSGSGNDTYMFGRGDGQDTIYDLDGTVGNLDTITFKAGVLPGQVQVARSGDWLILKIYGTTDQISVRDYFSSNSTSAWLIEQIRFTDAPGTVWSASEVNVLVLAGLVLNGTAGADTLTGTGNADILNGGAGNDTLLGENGNDTLDGGLGNDSLTGGAGNNTYLFGRGDGQDLVRVFSDATAGKLNTLQFKSGVLASEVSLKQATDSEIGGLALEV